MLHSWVVILSKKSHFTLRIAKGGEAKGRVIPEISSIEMQFEEHVK